MQTPKFSTEALLGLGIQMPKLKKERNPDSARYRRLTVKRYQFRDPLDPKTPLPDSRKHLPLVMVSICKAMSENGGWCHMHAIEKHIGLPRQKIVRGVRQLASFGYLNLCQQFFITIFATDSAVDWAAKRGIKLTVVEPQHLPTNKEVEAIKFLASSAGEGWIDMRALFGPIDKDRRCFEILTTERLKQLSRSGYTEVKQWREPGSKIRPTNHFRVTPKGWALIAKHI